eukprot:888509-Pyramimonas_sp.AAC.1
MPPLMKSLAERDAGHWADKRALQLRPKQNLMRCRPVFWVDQASALPGRTSGTRAKHRPACVRNSFCVRCLAAGSTQGT